MADGKMHLGVLTLSCWVLIDGTLPVVFTNPGAWILQFTDKSPVGQTQALGGSSFLVLSNEENVSRSNVFVNDSDAVNTGDSSRKLLA